MIRILIPKTEIDPKATPTKYKVEAVGDLIAIDKGAIVSEDRKQVTIGLDDLSEMDLKLVLNNV